MRKKIPALFVALLTLAMACSDLEHSNPLDPKNPDGQAPRRVLIEAFINDIGGAAISASLAGLALLGQTYDRELVIMLEHHIQRTAATDSLALATSLNRYEVLVPQPSAQAIPDVFFDGLAQRAQGASDVDAAYSRYSEALTRALQIPAKMTIQAQVVLAADRAWVSASLARLGRQDAENVTLFLAVTSEVYPGRPVVRVYLPMEAPGRIKAGEVESFERELIWAENIRWIRPQCVLLAADSQTREIYHCALANLQME